MLSELIKLSPCPVHFKTLQLYGQFCNTTTHSNRWIEIKENISVDIQVGTLAHEIGHCICYDKGCKCYNPKKKALCEYHAFMYSLSLLYLIGDKNILRICMENMITSYYKNSGGWYKYHIATKHAMNTNLWQRCIKLVYGQKQLLLFS